MPTWGDILKELNATASTVRGPDFDAVRRKYLSALHRLTGRNTILYASAWLENKPNTPPQAVSIGGEDLHGLMETVHGLTGDRLDFILHSPGGEIETAEAMVTYLRSRFSDIRVIVPGMAMSAAAMISCAANRILMGTHSFLGPIDPQLALHTPLGPRMVPAYAMLEQFELAKRECTDPSKLGAWLPMLNQFGPDLLMTCTHVLQLSQQLVRGWLASYMFAGQEHAQDRATEIADWLSNHAEMKTHGRKLSREIVEKHGLAIERLETDQALQDAVLSVYHAVAHTFAATSAVKIVENHNGRCYARLGVQQMMIQPEQILPAVQPPPVPPNRQQRRAADRENRRR